MKRISEEKKIFRKKMITIIGLIVSIIGAIFSLLYGITGLTTGAYWAQFYFYALIALAALTIFGDILGFYKKAVGIGVSLAIGIIGFILTTVFGAGNYDLGLIIPILLILIGGIIGFSANYENLKTWQERNWQGVSGIDEQMKSVYHLSIGLLIGGWTFFVLGFPIGFIGLYYMFLISFIGLPIGFIGLYGIYLYRSKPEKLRNYLLKRKKSKEKVSGEGDV